MQVDYCSGSLSLLPAALWLRQLQLWISPLLKAATSWDISQLIALTSRSIIWLGMKRASREAESFWSNDGEGFTAPWKTALQIVQQFNVSHCKIAPNLWISFSMVHIMKHSENLKKYLYTRNQTENQYSLVLLCNQMAVMLKPSDVTALKADIILSRLYWNASKN